ncbi:hypothetical protein TNCV_3265841 [Trichonephila clavipes]|nr:hypothetical protein TNCV_3265841 [Trichonephila clavipes]
MILLGSTPILRENTLREGQRPTTSHSQPSTSREDLRFDVCLDTMPPGHYRFTKIQALSGIRSQALRHSSQRR